MYLLKQLPEDFIVKEIGNVPLGREGKYLYFLLKKRNLNTIDAIRELARKVHLPEKSLGFAGNKDKKAVTEQYISITGIRKEKVLSISLPKATLEFAGQGHQPICLGDLQGNAFTIVIRNLEKKETISTVEYVENYFDEQRFGSHNVEIGRHLVKKEFSQALQLIQEHKQSQAYFQREPHDPIRTLRMLPIRLLRLFVNAYQSWLWNEVAAKYLKEKGELWKEEKYSQGTFIFIKNHEQFKELEIPLLGFTGLAGVPESQQQIVQDIMQGEKLSFADFVIKQIPELSAEGEMRKAFTKVENFQKGSIEEDELNQGKKKISASFTLPKGSYATMAIRRIIS